MIQLEGHIDNTGKLLLRDQSRLRAWVHDHSDKDVMLTIEQKRKKRTNSQNAYYWGVCIPLIQEAMNDLGNEFTKEETHEFLKARFNYKEIELKDGYFFDMPISTSKLNTIQFNEYIETIIRFAADMLGVIIPPPNEQLLIDYSNKS